MSFISSPITWLLSILFLVAGAGFVLFGPVGLLEATKQFFSSLLSYAA